MNDSWKGSQAGTFDDFAGAFGELLRHLENAEAMCEVLGKDGMLTETRSYAGGIRALQSELVNRARELRRHDDVDVLPMSLTTRKAG